ncbi:serine hydrolase-like protein 2 isoform X3 [Camelus ferus]|uniref:Serine hydrolase-like protein 2 isoform X3 n=1 Tax=Camelus ferus TaxID=419612 RepID=A0A8B8U1B9_CAMFR|nr:serine hydrolase-like protein 2 isoform X3 [Camelus ferus]XP_045376552.1 serine hydrolase-like protein 2 isoform X3 [Camelus bactrianus]
MPSLTGRLEGAVSRNLLHVASQDSGSPKLEKQAPGVWGHAGQFSELKLAVPWGHIAAKAWGSQQGPPVLCLHGWLDNANSFDRLIPLLSKDFHYVAMDFGGHGLSSHYSPGLPYYHQNFVSEVRRVAAALKWSRFSLIGHSFGGLVGGMEIENLLTYKRRNTEHTLQVEASKKPSKVVSQEAMLQGFLKNNSHVGEECGALLLQRGTTQVATGLVLNRDRRIAKIEHCLDFVSKELFEHYIRKLQARVLLIKATQGYHDVRRENDANTEPMLFKIGMLRAVLKERFQFVEVTGNHYVHMNQPQLVASVINSFLQSKERIPAQL